MRTRWLPAWVAGAVVLLAVVAGVLFVGRQHRAGNATPSTVVVMQTVIVDGSDQGGSGTGTSNGPGTPSAPGTPADPTSPSTPGAIPMVRLAPGEQPPQFVIFSFDGAGNSTKLHEFMDAAAASNAHFTGFLTGLYLVEDDKADVYAAPGAGAGDSDVGFGGDETEIRQRIDDLNALYAAGNEIGTHFNGHFCDLGAGWTTADWNDELDQYFTFLTDWKSIDGIADAPDLSFPVSEIKGGRTPCLADEWSQLAPALTAHGMTYDSSQPAPRDGIFWPELTDGIWEFYMPQVYSAGLGRKVTAMDYNFWYSFNGATEDPDSAAELTPIVLDTYRYMYQQAYDGNRAPVLIANHFNNWNGNSFNPATDQFMRETCAGPDRRPDTYCATYSEVIAWMELQDPAVLAELQGLPSVAYEAPAAG